MKFTEGYSLYIGNRIRREMKTILIILAIGLAFFAILVFMTKEDAQGAKMLTFSGITGGLCAGLVAFVSGSSRYYSKYGKEDCFFITMKNRFEVYKGYYVGLYVLMDIMFLVMSILFDTYLWFKGGLTERFVSTLIFNVEIVQLIMALSPFLHSVKKPAVCYPLTFILTFAVKVGSHFVTDFMTAHLLLIILLGLVVIALPFLSIPYWLKKIGALYESE